MLQVKFNTAKAGWLRFEVSTDDQIFKGSFSAVFDPVTRFKAWLEA